MVAATELTVADWRTIAFIACGASAGCLLLLLALWRRHGWTAGSREFDAERQQIVEMVAQNQNLKAILSRMVESVERQQPSFRVAVLLLRNARLQAEASQSLPDEVLREIEGTIDDEPGASPCFARTPQWSDIASEPRCEKLAPITLRLGIAGLWTFPLYSGADEILGVLCIFSSESKRPPAKVEAVVEMVSRLAAIAIEQRNVVDELSYRAQHDPLTKLYNHVMLEERLQECIQAAGWRRGSVSLLYIDLDRFKLVNDFLGHRAGDATLQQVAVRLASCIEPEGILSRAGGDEFIALLPSAESQPDPSKAAQKLLEAMEEPFFLGEHEIHISASIGISICPLHATDSNALERNAYNALYEAKKSGRNQYCIFQPSLPRTLPEHLEIERHLRSALRNQELYLDYQPQLDVQTLQIVGAEGLLRWKHPVLGNVSPSIFVPIAEESGVIGAIGTWVLQQATAQREQWLNASGMPIRISVNVSAAQFDRPDFLEVVNRALESTGIDPRSLVLELTESAVMQNLERSVHYMNDLNRRGIEFSLDDFGTGHSSLAQLRKLPIQELKIDRSFVQEIEQADDRPALVESIISMAHRLGMRTVAEGVEDWNQFCALKAMNCDIVQGFLFARPLSPDKFRELASRINKEVRDLSQMFPSAGVDLAALDQMLSQKTAFASTIPADAQRQ
jgi:diguanylate cyclase (GGDEF)-like protein